MPKLKYLVIIVIVEKVVEYREYVEHHDEELGDCCVKCRTIKIENTMINNYGVNNGCGIALDFRKKQKKPIKKRYGTEWVCNQILLETNQSKLCSTNMVLKRPLQNEAILVKMIKTRRKNLGNPTSNHN